MIFLINDFSVRRWIWMIFFFEKKLIGMIFEGKLIGMIFEGKLIGMIFKGKLIGMIFEGKLMRMIFSEEKLIWIIFLMENQLDLFFSFEDNSNYLFN